MRRALVWILPLATLACSAVDPCAGVSGTCLAVHVSSSAVRQLDALDVAVTVGAVHGTATTARSGPTSLPAVTAIELGASIAMPTNIRVALSADRAGAVVATGSAATTIAPGEHASVDVRLGTAVDAGAPPDLAGPDCVPGGFYCGGDKLDGDPQTLYKCQPNGSGTVAKSCPNGCQVNPGTDDACK